MKKSKLLLSLSAILLATSISHSAQIYRPKLEKTVTPKLENYLNQRNEKDVLVWIYFTDKGFTTREDLNKILAKKPKIVSERSLKRRSKELKNGINFEDLPLDKNYLTELQKLGVKVKKQSKWINAVSSWIPREKISEIGNLTFVHKIDLVMRGKSITEEAVKSEKVLKSVEQNSTNEFFLNYGPSFPQNDQINVIPLHEAGFSGAGVLVAMFDTGYMTEHTSFSEADVIAEWDFVNDDSNTNYDPNQDVPNQFNHGTGTWGTLGGYEDGQLIGPAFNSSFILAKTEDIASELPVEEDNWAAAIEWADSIGVDVVSSSLGYKTFDNGFAYSPQDLNGDVAVTTIAADYAASIGIVVCNSAGNSGAQGASSLNHPADADSILTVGAVNSNGQIAGFSSRGPTFDGRTKPEVCARGVATVWSSTSGVNNFGTANGTSLSCPLVGGAAALLIEAHPEWTAMQVRDALMNTASQSQNPDNDYGWGIIDVEEAMSETPMTYPYPFDLVSPTTNGVNAPFINFEWDSTEDTDGFSVTYTLKIADNPEFTNSIEYSGLSTTHFAATTNASYVWWQVAAVDISGNERLARKAGSFTYGQTTQLSGDVNGDNAVTEADAEMILEHIVGNIVLTGVQLNIADVNQDSEIRVDDASAIIDGL